MSTSARAGFARASVCAAERFARIASDGLNRFGMIHGRFQFPVNEPELWSAYVPAGVTQYLRLFSEWGDTKLDRLRKAGYEVVVLDEGTDKEISGNDVRAALRSGGDWESLVPPGVARVIKSLQRVTV